MCKDCNLWFSSCSKIRLATENMDRRIRNGASPEDAWNQTSIELTHCAESHCRVFLVTRFIETIQKLTTVSKQLHETLLQLCELYAIYWALQRVGDFLRVGISCFYKIEIVMINSMYTIRSIL